MKGQLNMSNFEVTFKGLLLEFLKRRGISATEVTGYEDSSRTESWGGCETCGWDEQVYEVDIYYLNDDPEYRWNKHYTYDGKFSDLLGELIEIGKEMDAREAE